jgi:L-rhamnose mutarotase
MRVALHTRVRADRIEEYEGAHGEVPGQLVEAIRAGGATAWTIWRSGTDLFHVIDCEDYEALIAYVGAQPVNTAWQACSKSPTTTRRVRVTPRSLWCGSCDRRADRRCSPPCVGSARAQSGLDRW